MKNIRVAVSILLIGLTFNFGSTGALDCANKIAAQCKLEFGLELERLAKAAVLESSKNYLMNGINWAKEQIDKSADETWTTELTEFVSNLNVSKAILDENLDADAKKKRLESAPAFNMSPRLFSLILDALPNDGDEFDKAYFEVFLNGWNELYAQLLIDRPTDVATFPEYSEINESFKTIATRKNNRDFSRELKLTFRKVERFFNIKMK